MADIGDILRMDDRRAQRRDRGVHVPAAELRAVDVEPEVGVKAKAGIVRPAML